jgi:PAS domain S-box-containing protein
MNDSIDPDPRSPASSASAASASAPRLATHDAVVLQAVFDTTNAGIFCIAENGRLSHVNPALASLLGYTVDELVGRNFTCIAPPDVAARADRFLRALLENSERISHDWNARHKDGRLVPLKATFNTIAGINAQRLVVITATDLTTQRAAEVELRRNNEALEIRVAERTAAANDSEAQYRNLVDHAPVGVCVLVDGIVKLANRRLAEVLAVEVGAMLEQSLLNWTHADDHELAHTKGSLRATGAIVPPYEIRMLRADNETIWCEVSGTRIEWRGAGAHLLYLNDTTEQHLLQQSLESSLAQRDTFLASTTVGVSFWRDDVIIWYNEALAQMLGYDRATLVGKHGSAFYPDTIAYQAARREAARQIALSGGCTFDMQAKRADGTLIWLNLNARPINPADSGQGWLGTFVDISERKKLEARVHEALAERERYLNMVTVGVGFFRDTSIVWHNKTLARMLGYADGELNGKPTTIFYPNDATYQRVLKQTVQQIEATGRCSFDVDVVRKDGALISVNLNAQAIDRLDWSRGRVWTFIDVSERNQLRQRLSNSLAERDTFLDLAGVGVSFASSGRVTWHNRTLARMLGYEAEALVGKPTSIVYPDAAAAQVAGTQALADIERQGYCVLEVQMVRKDRSQIWVELYGRPVQPGNPDAGRVWTFVDISGRKQAEAETLKALARERELVEMRTRLVAMASHEFRTPLATLLSSGEILDHYGDRLPSDERKEVIDSITSAVKRLQAMLENVTHMGRAESLILKFQPSPTPLKELCRRIHSEMRSIDEGEHRLEHQFADAADEIWSLDAELLRTILTNLIGNACKYTPRDGLIRFTVERDANRLTFQVIDHGIGIPKSDLPRLFDNFFRASNVGQIAGTGIGLALAKRATETHGGAIHVTSEVGVGTTFTVTLQAEATMGSAQRHDGLR